MSPNLVALLYLVAGVLFILALRGLSSPDSSQRGNLFGPMLVCADQQDLAVMCTAKHGKCRGSRARIRWENLASHDRGRLGGRRLACR